MMASIPAYNAYARDVLMPAMDPEVLAEIQSFEEAEDYANPRYRELLLENHYVNHVLRMPADEWPDPVNRGFAKINYDIYIPLQGPSELGASGKLETWDRMAALPEIGVPTLVIGAKHDTMDPKHMEWMASTFPIGRYLYCPDGSHLALYDDQATYFEGLIEFIGDVDDSRF
jgi:proline iminopeptidase